MSNMAEPYKIKMVEKIYTSTREERLSWIEKASYNLFNLRSNQVYIDMLTDSGTGAMSNVQWSEMFLGDESYAGASSYYKLEAAVKEIFNVDYILPTHQGRAAENVLMSHLVTKGDVILGNTHFDTTKAHIEFRHGIATDCSISEAYDHDSLHPFKGSIDIQKLEDEIIKNLPKVKLVIVTITCNNAGGQPVSLQNMKDVYKLSKSYNIPVCFDSARFAENAYFIKEREEEYKDWEIKDIVLEMYKYCDIMTMSCKKDAIVNIGGLLGFRDKKTWESCQTFNILFEGYNTYGGLAGRDINAIACGLYEVIEFDYLHSRIGQVRYFAEKLDKVNIPYIKPVGGHAVYIDAGKFLSNVHYTEFPAQTLGVELYIDSGVRGVEIGSILADRDPNTGENRYAKFDLLRLCIPRRTYTNSHMDVVATSLVKLYERRDSIKQGLKITAEAPIIRHFTVKLERINADDKTMVLNDEKKNFLLNKDAIKQ